MVVAGHHDSVANDVGLDVLNDLGWALDLPSSTPYFGLINVIAAYELGRLTAADLHADRNAVVQQMAVGQVVFGQLLLSLRRLVHEYHSALKLSDNLLGTSETSGHNWLGGTRRRPRVSRATVPELQAISERGSPDRTASCGISAALQGVG